VIIEKMKSILKQNERISIKALFEAADKKKLGEL
jgi:hypothetical protein